jgi:hypothetical protein
MAYPTPSAPGSGAASTSSGCTGSGFPQSRGSEGEHLLEKLEFALAVAITRGDAPRIQALRDQIAALGGNSEEPGT